MSKKGWRKFITKVITGNSDKVKQKTADRYKWQFERLAKTIQCFKWKD
jgi:hypothetical protein